MNQPVLKELASGSEPEDKTETILVVDRAQGPACPLPIHRMPSSVDTFGDLLWQVRQLKQDGKEEVGVPLRGNSFWLCVPPAGCWEPAGARFAAETLGLRVRRMPASSCPEHLSAA